MSELKVIGHIGPDTDSTCSPIVYAWFLNDIKEVSAKAYLSGEPNKEALFVLSECGVEKPEIISEFAEGDSLVIIDTNNPEELLPGVEKAEIVEIVDHHKLVGRLSTEKPPTVTMSPLACSATVIWEIFEKHGEFEIPRYIAKLMLSAILSDTLNMTSPTTTDKDREVAEKLAEIAGVDADEYAGKMFDAKSDLSGMNAQDILLMDSKLFELGEKKVRVSVLETTNPQISLDMKDELFSAYASLLEKDSLDMLFFFVVDILKNESTLVLFSEDEKSVAKKAFDVSVESGVVVLPGVVSRKKQMIPALEGVLK